MRKMSFSRVVVIAITVFLFSGLLLQQRSKAAATVLQYKVMSMLTRGPEDAGALERTLNQMGAQGWEVVLKDGPLYVFRK